MVGFVAHVREIRAPRPGDAEQAWTPELLESHWQRAKYPPYGRKPSAESGFLRTFGDWSIGFTPNGSLREKALHGIILPLLVIGLLIVFMFIPRIADGEAVMTFGSLILAVIMLTGFYILNQYSVLERAAMSLCHQGYPMRLSSIDRWIRQSLRISGWIIDVIVAVAFMTIAEFPIVTGILMLVLLRLLRDVLRLHVLNNTWVRGHIPEEAPTGPQIISVAYVVAQIIWFAIVSVAYMVDNGANVTLSVWDGVFFWLIALFLPMLGHWVLIRGFLARRVGWRFDRAVI